MPSILVFCDLDDTLFASRSLPIDSSTRLALDCIQRQQLPIVVFSRRTRAECEILQQELGIAQPFVCEDGGAVFLPPAYFGSKVSEATTVSGYEVVEFGRTREEVITTLHRAAEALGVRVVGFSDMSVDDVSKEFGMTLLEARLAKLREYTEPFQVLAARSGALPRLLKVFRAVGLDCTRRDRHFHLAANRRWDCAQYLRSLYRRRFGETLTAVFCDHTNAAAILCEADIPLIVATPGREESERLRAAIPAARFSAVNSIGEWAEAILEIADASARHAKYSRIWRECHCWPLGHLHRKRHLDGREPEAS